MIDYSAARAVALIVQTGSFERAAAALNVTPSAVSQRVRQIEERVFRSVWNHTGARSICPSARPSRSNGTGRSRAGR